MRNRKPTLVLALLVTIVFFARCDSKDESHKDDTVFPLLTTKEVTDIRHNSARSGGELIEVGTLSVSSKGIIWGTSTKPEFGNHDGAASAGTGPGEFSARLTSLKPATGYYVRAYANHKIGTAYGNEVYFETKESGEGGVVAGGQPCPDLPVLVDPRDGKTYNTVLIGNQCWMKENLNFQVENSWCYRNSTLNCNDFGRLYTWYAAMDLAEGAQSGSDRVQGVCPPGWHLPSDFEWLSMERMHDSKYSDDIDEWEKNGYRGFDAGRNLKANWGWDFDGNGEDIAGFSAMPGGRRFIYGQYYTGGSYGFWWTSSQKSQEFAYYRFLYYNSDLAYRFYFNKGSGLSVRCIKD